MSTNIVAAGGRRILCILQNQHVYRTWALKVFALQVIKTKIEYYILQPRSVCHAIDPFHSYKLKLRIVAQLQNSLKPTNLD